MTPYPHLPYSHTGLKVFEVVARLLSFTSAANELHVTQSAVSRQVRQLEEELNTPLIIRKHRSIELTHKGKELFVVLNSNFQAIEDLLTSWQKSGLKKVVIKAAFSYATRLLIPKFQQINERYPDYEIVVIPELAEDEGINQGDYDLLIFNTRNGAQYQNDPDFEFMREEYMAPVYTSRVAPDNDNLESVLSMARIHPTYDQLDWKHWLKNLGRQEGNNVRETTFLTLDLALSACLAGQGVTVTDLLLVLPELEQSFLSAPSKVPVHYSPWQYYIHKRTKTAVVQDLAEFFQEETRKDIAELNRLAEKKHWGGVFS